VIQNMCVIKDLQEHEVPAAAAMLIALPLMNRYRATKERLDVQLRQALCQPGIAVIVARPDEPGAEIAGLAWFATEGTFLMGGYLKLLALADQYRGKGLGRKLLDVVESRVRVRSPYLFLLASDDNEAAHRFYERLGYVQAGRFEHLVLDDVNELVYFKKLV